MFFWDRTMMAIRLPRRLMAPMTETRTVALEGQQVSHCATFNFYHLFSLFLTTTVPALPQGCVRDHVVQPAYWCDGVLVSVIGAVGLLGNLMAIVVLSRKNIRDLFHRLLLALVAFDLGGGERGP